METRPHAKTKQRAKTKPTITHLIIMGDSLSDRGTLYKRKLFGLIPMDIVVGLKGKSPDESFTNGFTWSEDFIASLVDEFTIRQFKSRMHLDATDISDGIIDGDERINYAINHYSNLQDSYAVDFRGENFVRDYTEGGLSSHSYRGVPSFNIGRFFTRLILSNLKAKRQDLLAYDEKNDIPDDNKAHTLVIEWSGANDLITVNAKPSRDEVDKAVRDRIKNIKKLIEHGYKNFVLFNLPDLSLTPRFQAKSEHKQERTSQLCDYFNETLKQQCDELQQTHKDCLIQVFDVDSHFKDMYQNPSKYGLKEGKLRKPYTKSKHFKMLKNGTSPANGYMFWDDVHPTADVHAILADTFYDFFRKLFYFSAPPSLASEQANDDTIRLASNDTILSAPDKFGLFSHASYERKYHKPIITNRLRNSC